MGLTNAKLVLKNPRRPDLQPLEVAALADTGSVFLCIPPHVQIQLGLEEVEKREATPRTRTVDVNPNSPNIASGIVK